MRPPVLDTLELERCLESERPYKEDESRIHVRMRDQPCTWKVLNDHGIRKLACTSDTDSPLRGRDLFH